MEKSQKNVDDEFKKFILRFDQTFQYYLKITVGNIEYNPTKHDRKKIIDTAINKTDDAGPFFLSLWRIECNDEINPVKTTKFLGATKTYSPTGNTR